MAYSNIFPVGYQAPAYYPQQMQAPAPQMGSNLIWVQGEAGAKSYMVAPNNTVQLWDSESQTIYLKSADASGMPSIKTLDYTIRNSGDTPSTPSEAPRSDFVTKDEVSSMQEDITALKRKIEALEKGGRNANKYHSNNKSAQ